MKSKLYLAAPLFSEAEKTFNKRLKQKLGIHFDVYLPQEDGRLIVNMLKEGIPFKVASRAVFEADLQAIRTADILLIVLDGRTVDEGVAIELGYAYNLGKRCIGYSTDPRTLLPDGQNPMVFCCLEAIVQSTRGLLAHMGKSANKCANADLLTQSTQTMSQNKVLLCESH